MNQQPKATFLEQRLTMHRGKRTYDRRGVSSVLAMMFMVIFGSLAAAMAVVAQGNLRTADSALQVSRAMSAAETGMTFAIARLSAEACTPRRRDRANEAPHPLDLGWNGDRPGVAGRDRQRDRHLAQRVAAARPGHADHPARRTTGALVRHPCAQQPGRRGDRA